MSYYRDDDDDDVDIRARRRGPSPRPNLYSRPPSRGHSFFDIPSGVNYIPLEQHARVVVEREPVRSRSRSRRRNDQPPSAPNPFNFTERFVDESLSDDDYDGRSHVQLISRDANSAVVARGNQSPDKEVLFQTCFNADCPQDVTTHIDLPIFDDIGDELEDFSRLMRIGNFQAAKSYFEANLADHQAQPFVFVQYAEMLLEMSDYKSFGALNPHSVFGQPCRQLRSEAPEHSRSALFNRRRSYGRRARGCLRKPDAVALEQLDLLHLNWDLLETTYLVYREGTIHQAINVAKEALRTVNLDENAGSTEIKIFCLASHILGEARAWNVGPRLATRELPSIPKIYSQLLSEGRIWDFHDFFSALIPWFNFSVDTVMMKIYGTAGYSRRLLDDWVSDMSDTDESTILALLSLIVSVLRGNLRNPRRLQMMDQWMSDAQSLAHCLKLNHIGCLKSRAFARWVAVEAAGLVSIEYGSFEGAVSERHASAPGLTFAWGLGVPVYVPATIENPNWQMPGVPPEQKEPIIMAWRLSRELQDYQTEEFCLELLIVVSQDPKTYFEELSHLQNSVQKNRRGFLWTCLSKYLISGDVASKRQLLEDLKSFPDWVDRDALSDPPACFARDFIRGALSSQLKGHNVHRKYPTESFKKSIEIYGRLLPPEMSEFVRRETGIGWSNNWGSIEFAREPYRFRDITEKQLDRRRLPEPVNGTIFRHRSPSRERPGPHPPREKDALLGDSKKVTQKTEPAPNETEDAAANTRAPRGEGSSAGE
ncbi:hypothetical protein JDV02_006330 [Purpureocillium takamizusanense]|uniref:Uncharacterized protein n=1 Tax=Purpureocillium takamizusanense TaxID=2060973 RepID=A0A9Q8VCT8_9HYPO|nr:uncharacterized protein JDV02_006330 [Purpureocillium takamizusanense]UNI20224.1 hypothetical protein JDV02_006330 [Purpureocillium takamizusanense]